MIRTTIYLRESQIEAIKAYREESLRSEEIPELNRSDIIRDLLDAGIEETPEIEEQIPESVQIKYRRERFKDRKGWLKNMRAGFRKRVAEDFKSRFRDGWNQEEISSFAENMRQDAHLLWPGEEYAEERADAIRYVETVEESAREAIERSEIDPLDPEEIFAHFEGVEQGEVREISDGEREDDLFEQAVEEALDRIEKAPYRNNEAITQALSKQFVMSEDLAAEAVSEARNQYGGAADD